MTILSLFVRRAFRNFHPENYGHTGGKPRLCAQTLHRGETDLFRIVLSGDGDGPDQTITRHSQTCNS